MLYLLNLLLVLVCNEGPVFFRLYRIFILFLIVFFLWVANPEQLTPRYKRGGVDLYHRY